PKNRNQQRRICTHSAPLATKKIPSQAMAELNERAFQKAGGAARKKGRRNHYVKELSWPRPFKTPREAIEGSYYVDKKWPISLQRSHRKRPHIHMRVVTRSKMQRTIVGSAGLSAWHFVQKLPALRRHKNMSVHRPAFATLNSGRHCDGWRVPARCPRRVSFNAAFKVSKSSRGGSKKTSFTKPWDSSWRDSEGEVDEELICPHLRRVLDALGTGAGLRAHLLHTAASTTVAVAAFETGAKNSAQPAQPASTWPAIFQHWAAAPGSSWPQLLSTQPSASTIPAGPCPAAAAAASWCPATALAEHWLPCGHCGLVDDIQAKNSSKIVSQLRCEQAELRQAVHDLRRQLLSAGISPPARCPLAPPCHQRPGTPQWLAMRAFSWPGRVAFGWRGKPAGAAGRHLPHQTCAAGRVRRALAETALLLTELMDRAHERGWPDGVASLEQRQTNRRRQYDSYVIRRVPGKQAAACCWPARIATCLPA
uniref:RING-type E3 ubiquitin transferase n=1 Tax=Macrostomum lignano TaxID=282301 RepID=A0A1I8FNV6_9PLAT